MLNVKQKLFVKEYLSDPKLNGPQAAVRAGYAETGAASLLNKPEIAMAVQEAMDIRSARLDITADRVLVELSKMAFANIADFIEWDDGKVRVLPGKNLSEDQTAAIAEITETPGKFGSSIKVKLHDKKSNLELLARHLKILGTANDFDDGDIVAPVQVVINAVDASDAD
jgi:phage terminase small subunit